MSNDWLGNWLGNYLFPSFHFFMHLIMAMLGNRVSLTFFISNQVAQGLTLKMV